MKVSDFLFLVTQHDTIGYLLLFKLVSPFKKLFHLICIQKLLFCFQKIYSQITEKCQYVCIFLLRNNFLKYSNVTCVKNFIESTINTTTNRCIGIQNVKPNCLIYTLSLFFLILHDKTFLKRSRYWGWKISYTDSYKIIARKTNQNLWNRYFDLILPWYILLSLV